MSDVTTARRHIAIIAPPTPGHMNPLQALGSELAGLGHRVTFIHQSDAAALINDPRIGFESLSQSISEDESLAVYLRALATPTGAAGLTSMIRSTAAMTERLLQLGPAALKRIGADVIIADSAEPAGELLAQHLELPFATCVTGLPLIGEADVPPPYVGWSFRAGPIGRFRNRAGYMVANRLLRPVTEVVQRYKLQWGLTDQNSGPRLYAAQCPKGLDYERQSLPRNFYYGGPWRLHSPADINMTSYERPLVFCSLGTLQGSRRHLFAMMSEACALVGARAVIAHGGGLNPIEEAALPGEPFVRAFWPQEAVLRHCTAAILHGGFNTVLDALTASIPIVAMPIAFEQPGTAARLAWFGAGEVMALRSATVRRLAAKLKRVMSEPHYRDRASVLALEIRNAGGAAGASARINDALGSG